MFEHTSTDKKKLILSIFLAILIYSLLLLLLLCTHYGKQDPWHFLETSDEDVPITFANMPEQEESLPTQLPQPTQQEAAMHSRPSVFGATNEEQEIPEFLPGTTDSFSKQSIDTSDEEEKKIESIDLKIPPENELEELKPPHEVSEKDINTDIALTQQEEAVQIKSDTSQNDTIAESTSISDKTAHVALSEKTKIQSTIQKIQSMIPQSSKNSPKRSQGPTRDNTGDGSKIASPVKKELSFADLAKGFIEQQGNGGRDWIDKKGDETIRPHIQELKNASYNMKLQWYVQKFLRQRVAPTQRDWTIGIKATCNITIDENGNIKDIQLVHSSGHVDYDNWIIDFFKSITPYPKPPVRLLTPHFNIQWTIFLSDIQRIQYSY